MSRKTISVRFGPGFGGAAKRSAVDVFKKPPQIRARRHAVQKHGRDAYDHVGRVADEIRIVGSVNERIERESVGGHSAPWTVDLAIQGSCKEILYN